MTKNKQRNWRRLLAGCLVAVVVLGLVIAAAILLTGSPDFTGTGTPAAPGISLEEWLAGSLSPKSFNGTWISGKYLTFLFARGRVMLFSRLLAIAEESQKKTRLSTPHPTSFGLFLFRAGLLRIRPRREINFSREFKTVLQWFFICCKGRLGILAFGNLNFGDSRSVTVTPILSR
ncbi:hypothetical protein WN51_05089 [Melipona quadrifasciata]|uniref:Dipeptidyl aminopeptidase-like protein 6 n=1 Tax=Melipona quadrifasciata TaxID=166423 RepID=A0A0M8ZRC0_9HYME|nr:hypothetical protein WN51_05089 [Melipona quadrifasciata]